MLALGSNTVRSADLTWTGSASTDWNNPANWTPQQVPATNDHVIINSSSVTIPADGAFAMMDWTGGSINGWLTVASSGVLNINGGSSPVYLGGALTNAGTVNWNGGDLRFYNCNFAAGPMVNLAGAVWNIQCDQNLSGFGTCADANEYFQNAGTVRKSAGTGTSSISVQFDNTGIVEADTGTIAFQEGYSGNSSANLVISVGGALPGSGYSRISFSTPLSFDGTFTVSTRNGYLPNPGATFQVLSYPSATNSFTCLSGLDLGGGILLQPQFGPTALTLLATAYKTNASQPQLFVNHTLGGLAITWPVGFQGWALQSTTNLSSAAWSMVSNACVNQAVVPISAPQQYFRLIGN